MNKKFLKKIIDLNRNKIPYCTVSKIDDTNSDLFTLDDSGNGQISKNVKKAITEDQLLLEEIDGEEYIFNPFNPPIKLIIVGAVHVAQSLASMAKIMDFDVIIIDPREAFATEERFPNTLVLTSWPDEALSDIKIDKRTCLVTLTHEPNLDDPALKIALESDCFYIGALGSKKTHGKRMQRLKDMGFDEDITNRVNGPIGLPINAKKPNEIAASIISEIISCLRHKNTTVKKLRENWKLR
ncbi:MAG: XdhC family protein [Pseudomonadota bacterium]|nr:XdhC family protein [Pseudomonadota bacterium]MEE3294707.1 XdhC family protein [Pseudomonadota bacterium]|tara:strand:+ start:4214 stop:4933 length:720 start_codon:yes stop_codon:yes gene_type:complete